MLDHNQFSKASFSQSGEDMIIDYIFKLRDVEKPSYIDIGANHPFYLNNTAYFYKKGCRGVNIEANPQLIESFNTHRPKDININIGVADRDDEMDFYIMSDNTLSSFAKIEVDKMIENGKSLHSTIKVKLTTIHNIITKYCDGIFPDLLTIDVEGLDFEILKTIDYNLNFPKVICVEAAEYSVNGSGAKRTELINFLMNKNYYEYANTNLNAIMVRKDFWFK